MKQLSLPRLLAITIFTFALTTYSSTMEPAVYGHKILELAPRSPNTLLGLMTFVGLLVAMLTQPVVGMLSDRAHGRLGRRLPFFIAGTLMLTICIYVVALAPSLPALVISVLLLQGSSNTIQGPWQALIPDLAPAEQKGAASSLKALLDIAAAVTGRFSAGMIISQAPVIGDLAVVQAVTVPVILMFVALAITAWGIRSPDGIQAVIFAQPATRVRLRARLRDTFAVDLRRYPAFGWWFVNRILFWCAFISLTIFLPFFAVDVLGMTESGAQRYVSQVSAALGGAVIVAALLTNRAAKRIGRKPLMIGAGVAAALGVVGVLLARDLTVLTGIGLFIGLAAGVYLVASFAMITDIVPPAEAARYMGIANVATAGGSAIGRLLGGVLIDSLNASLHSTSAGYLALYALAAALFALSALVILPMQHA